jgi:hypothetical protein
MTPWAGGQEVTHHGERQTVTSALPTLIRLSKNPGKVRGILGCGRHGGALHAVPDPAREVADLDWSVCPLELLAHLPHLNAIRQLDKMAGVAPLAGWPDRYAAWAVVGLLAQRELAG